MKIHHSLIETYDVIEPGDIFSDNNVIEKNEIVDKFKPKLEKIITLKENNIPDLDYIDEEFIEKILLSDKDNKFKQENNNNYHLLIKYLSISFYFYLFINTYI